MQLLALANKETRVGTIKQNLPESVESETEKGPNLATIPHSELSDPKRPSSGPAMCEDLIGWSKLKQLRRRPYNKPGVRCRAGTCPCRCHRRSLLRWRLISLSFTDMSSFNGPCNDRECSGPQINISAQVQISYWKLKLAVLTSLDVSWSLGTLSISPVLRARRLVDDDSASFRIVKDFHDDKSSLLETVRALNKAFDSGEASRMDCTHERSLIDEILAISSQSRHRSTVDCLQLVDMTGLCHGLVDSASFVFLFWTGFFLENTVMLEAVIDTDILDYVRDFAILPLVFRCLRNDIGISVDPFQIHTMKGWIKRCPGFRDVPEGIESILSGQTYQGNGHTDAPSISLEDQWLGLSGIFWATTDASILRNLLAQSHDPNSTDERDRTPVFYAAAYGNLDCVIMLLEAGARPDAYDTESRNPLVYALENDHPHVAIESLQYLRNTPAYSDKIYKTILNETVFFACQNSSSTKNSTLQSLCQMGADVNTLGRYGETLCHGLGLPAHAQVLFDHGFGLLNMPGPNGRSCLHDAARRHNAPLLRFYLSKGARLQATDNYGRNVLQTSFMSLDNYFTQEKPHAWYSTVRTLIASGVDVLTGDNCRCMCSTKGCSPAKALCLAFCSRTRVYSTRILPIEYLLLLEEMVDKFTAEETLSEIIRVFLFEDLELTHVCCRSVSHGPRINEEDEIREIQDEERLLIEQLNDEVNAVLESSLGRSPAEFFEEFLFDYIAKRLRSTSAQYKHQDFCCYDVACLECWDEDLSGYLDFITDIYRERSNDEALRDLDKTWLQKRKSMVQRCNSKVATMRNMQKDLPSAVEELRDQSFPYDRITSRALARSGR